MDHDYRKVPESRKGLFMSLGPTELLVILGIVLLLFGSTKLPKLARSMGQASKEFKQGLADGASKDDPEDEKAK
jgi:sec-independent protein translocase protein TatA